MLLYCMVSGTSTDGFSSAYNGIIQVGGPNHLYKWKPGASIRRYAVCASYVRLMVSPVICSPLLYKIRAVICHSVDSSQLM